MRGRPSSGSGRPIDPGNQERPIKKTRAEARVKKQDRRELRLLRGRLDGQERSDPYDFLVVVFLVVVFLAAGLLAAALLAPCALASSRTRTLSSCTRSLSSWISSEVGTPSFDRARATRSSKTFSSLSQLVRACSRALSTRPSTSERTPPTAFPAIFLPLPSSLRPSETRRSNS